MECCCGRPECGLKTGKLDVFDALHMWLPAFYLNFLDDSDFLTALKKTGEVRQSVFHNRLEAAQAHLKAMRRP